MITRKNLVYFTVIITLIFSAGLTSCKKKKSSSVPDAVTNPATNIGRRWALINASVTTQGQDMEITFEYDTTRDLTNTVAGVPATVNSTYYVPVYASLTGLKPLKKYYFRVKGVISGEVYYGTDTTFTTTGDNGTSITFKPGLTYDSINDIDGNYYKTISIGSQTWMAENLRTTRYNDGETVDYIPVSGVWADSSFAGYCWYNGDSVMYGGLYNWAAVSTGKLCPVGWHVPSDDEWTTLTEYLGGDTLSTGKLMETGIVHWYSTKSYVTNESGFTALPGGYRSFKGTYASIQKASYWWTSTEASTLDADSRNIYYSFQIINNSNSSKKSGFSVRCIKD
ncbi:MAG TPA: fibrobacter succinogenes major paralogous domain-containing protein [Bacteroidales bacterium]|nr:fibrobacter succinogenes major paralogous domain-containing protein [Bacteroidales bacterium]